MDRGIQGDCYYIFICRRLSTEGLLLGNEEFGGRTTCWALTSVCQLKSLLPHFSKEAAFKGETKCFWHYRRVKHFPPIETFFLSFAFCPVWRMAQFQENLLLSYASYYSCKKVVCAIIMLHYWILASLAKAGLLMFLCNICLFSGHTGHSWNTHPEVHVGSFHTLGKNSTSSKSQKKGKQSMSKINIRWNKKRKGFIKYVTL